MLTSQEAEARVAKGAAWLDRNNPGWERRIDVGTLRVSHGCHCILAQVYGCAFDKAAESAGLAFSGGVHALGFLAVDHNYEQLQNLWIQAIAERLARDPVAVPQAVHG